MPTVCEVDNAGFHDRKLKAKGFYKKPSSSQVSMFLCILSYNIDICSRRMDIILLKESTTLGPVKFSSWPIIFPNGGLKIR